MSTPRKISEQEPVLTDWNDTAVVQARIDSLRADCSKRFLTAAEIDWLFDAATQPQKYRFRDQPDSPLPPTAAPQPERVEAWMSLAVDEISATFSDPDGYNCPLNPKAKRRTLFIIADHYARHAPQDEAVGILESCLRHLESLSPEPPFDKVHEPEWVATALLAARIRAFLDKPKH